MLDLSDLDWEDVIGAVCLQGEWRFYADYLPTWIMNYGAYERVGDSKAPDRVPHEKLEEQGGFVFRRGIYVVDDSNAREFCKAIAPRELSIQNVSSIIQSRAIKSTDLQIVIDFDNRHYIDGTHGENLCRFVPKGWTCAEEYPVPFIPESVDVWPRAYRPPTDWYVHLQDFQIASTSIVAVRYEDQESFWPSFGRHILAQYDEESIVVYQAYRPAIGYYAARNGHFGGQFSYNRMSWIKPNFLWMMYRSGWGTKESQIVTLAVRIRRMAFDAFLAAAVPSSFDNALYTTREEWAASVAISNVRCQWDPDHAPSGVSVERRAIQLGLRGTALEQYGREAIVSIEDITDFVAEQRENVSNRALLTPLERVYVPSDPNIARRLQLTDV